MSSSVGRRGFDRKMIRGEGGGKKFYEILKGFIGRETITAIQQ